MKSILGRFLRLSGGFAGGLGGGFCGVAAGLGALLRLIWSDFERLSDHLDAGSCVKPCGGLREASGLLRDGTASLLRDLMWQEA